VKPSVYIQREHEHTRAGSLSDTGFGILRGAMAAAAASDAGGEGDVCVHLVFT